MRKAKRLLVLCITLFTCSVGFAQQKVEMADTFRSNGKIYVVVAVVVTILSGLIFYVARLDRKITKLEKHGGNI